MYLQMIAFSSCTGLQLQYHSTKRIWSCSISRDANSSETSPCRSDKCSRRKALQIALATAAIAAVGRPNMVYARRKPSKPLIAALVPLVRTSDSLRQFKEDIENGNSNRDVRRIMSVLLTGNKLNPNVKDAALWLPLRDAETAEILGKEAVEYLDQVVAYFDPVAMKDRPPAEYLSFAVKAIEAASLRLENMLKLFPDDEVNNARQQLSMNISY